jgi:hypothetical protein
MRHLSAPMLAKHTLWMSVALAAGILAAWLVVVLVTPTKRAEAAFPGSGAGRSDQSLDQAYRRG